MASLQIFSENWDKKNGIHRITEAQNGKLKPKPARVYAFKEKINGYIEERFRYASKSFAVKSEDYDAAFSKIANITMLTRMVDKAVFMLSTAKLMVTATRCAERRSGIIWTTKRCKQHKLFEIKTYNLYNTYTATYRVRFLKISTDFHFLFFF